MTYSDEVLADSPWGFWLQDETESTLAPRDLSGNGHHGALFQNVTFQATGLIATDTDKAISLAGTGGIQVPDATWIRPAVMSAEAWFKPTSLGGSAGVVLARADFNSGFGPAWSWAIYTNSTTLMFLMFVGDTTTHVADVPIATLSTGTTYHIVLTFDGSTARAYLNGAEVTGAASSLSGTLSPSAGIPLTIGADSALNFAGSSGTIDEVAYYDTVLNATRVAAHYTAGTTGSDYADEVLADDPLAYYRLDEFGPGSDLADSSGNDRDIVISGSAHTYNQPGPGSSRSVGWADATGKASTTVEQNFTTTALEAWVYLTANPAAITDVVSLASLTAVGSSGDFGALEILTSGVARWSCYDGTVRNIDTASGLALNAWHHLVGAIGAGGMNFYVDNVLIGTVAATALHTFAAKGVFLRGSNIVGPSGTGAMRIALPAVYPDELSAARVEVHYLAGLDAYAAEVLVDEPSGFWRLDEETGLVAVDSSGHGRHLAIEATAGATIDQAPVMPTGVASYEFDNVTDRLTRSFESWMAATAFSIEAWIYPTAVSSYRCIASADGTGSRGWSLYITDGKLNLFTGSSDVLATTVLSANTAYHVVVTYDSGTVKYYIDGELDATVSMTEPVGVAGFVVGASLAGTFGYNFPFTGRIDEIAFYDHALTATRVEAHYDIGLGAGAPPSGTATLSGSGTLAAAGAPALARTAALSGSGTLVAVGELTVPRATLSGSGTLTRATVVTVVKSVALTGSGTLAVAEELPPTGAVTIAGDPFAVSVIVPTGYAGLAAVVIPDSGPDPDPNDLDPTAVSISSGLGRWMFTDPETSGTYIFHINPNEMSSVHRVLNLRPSARSAVVPSQALHNGGIARVFQDKRQPLEWTFSGIIRTRSQYMQMRNWSHRQHRILVTDHFGRTWSVMFKGVKYEERQPTAQALWRFRYTATCTLYGRVS